MDRYPSALDTTQNPLWRRAANGVATASVSGVVSLAIAGGAVEPFGWWITIGLSVLAGAVIAGHEVLLRRRDAGAWTPNQWNLLRENEYRRRQGVFLTHTAAPALTPRDDGRTNWTITLQLVQHGTGGPLSEGAIDYVEYAFGAKFTEGSTPVHGPRDNFRYTTDLYGPLLVLARIVFKNPLKRPLIVERYVDLPPQ